MKWWRTTDWIWITVFAIFTHGFFIITKYNQINELISYVSTFVSMSLAAVAIYISVREATKTDAVKDEMNIILGEMKEKLSQVDAKVTKFDAEIRGKAQSDLGVAIFDYLDEHTKELPNKTEEDKVKEYEFKSQIQSIIEEKFNEFSKENNENEINKRNVDDEKPKRFGPSIVRQVLRKNGGELSMTELNDILINEKNISKNEVISFYSFLEKEKLIKIKDGKVIGISGY